MTLVYLVAIVGGRSKPFRFTDVLKVNEYRKELEAAGVVTRLRIVLEA